MKESLQARASRFLKIFLCLSGTLLILFTSCVKMPRRALSADGQTVTPAPSIESGDLRRININTASQAELERLPGIGRALAGRIIEYRQNFGRFRRAEHLMMVRGISARRFQAMRPLVIAE
jgi:competence ComEA-like helix-hairpin-helix protein